MKKKFLLLFACIVTSAVFSASLEDFVDSWQVAQLRSGGPSLTGVQTKSPGPQLLPRHSGLRQFIADTMNSLEPTLLVETLSLYQKPVSGDWNEAERAGLFNQILALSTLTGIEYYSESRKAMRVFYESSQVIDGPDSKRPVPDPVYAQPEPSLTIYARQKDGTFGDNIYRYDFRTFADALIFSQENMTALNVGIIQAIGKNRLRSVVAVIDADECLLIYAASMAKTVSVFGMGDRIGASFSNRAEAILKWFSGRADMVYAGQD